MLLDQLQSNVTLRCFPTGDFSISPSTTRLSVACCIHEKLFLATLLPACLPFPFAWQPSTYELALCLDSMDINIVNSEPSPPDSENVMAGASHTCNQTSDDNHLYQCLMRRFDRKKSQWKSLKQPCNLAVLVPQWQCQSRCQYGTSDYLCHQYTCLRVLVGHIYRDSTVT